MKNIPGTVKISGLIILGLLLIQACIHPVVSSGPVTIELVAAEVKDPDNFCQHVKDGVTKDATYGFIVIQAGKDLKVCCEPSDCKAPGLTLNLDKVTKSDTAGNSPHWGSHVTQRLSSSKSVDLGVVVGELKPHP